MRGDDRVEDAAVNPPQPDRRSGRPRRRFDDRDASFLAEASRLLADSLDYETTLGTVAMLALPHLGAWCIVDVVEEDGEIRRVAIVHPDPDKQLLARELQDGWPPDRSDPLGVPVVARTRSSEVVSIVDDTTLRALARSDRNLEILRQLGIGSVLVVPLLARGDVLGAITFVGPVHGYQYGEDDLSLAEDLAARAAIAIDNARLYRLAERAREAAERASAAKSQFLGVMSHELRTPINAILGYTQLLDMGVQGALTDEQRSLLERVEASSRHLLDLVTRVLDLSKAEAGQLEVQNEVHLLDDVLGAALKEVRPLVDRRTIQRRCDEGEPLRFVGDAIRARQILVNLLSNAIRFTDEKGTITVRCERADAHLGSRTLTGAGPWVRISIEDDGIGIPDEKLEAVFEPFVQGDGAPLVRRTDGSGLGLAVSRYLARLMGGELTVVSVPGEGSRFSVWLPAPRTPAQPRGERRLFRRDARGLSLLSDHLLRRLKPIMDSYVARLRNDPGIPRAGEASDIALRDHVPHFLSGMASLLSHSQSAGPDITAVLQGGNAIQRLTLELHGAERHALGWTTDALCRDLAILRDVIENGLRADIPADADFGQLSGVLTRLFEQAERISLQGWHYARSDGPATGTTHTDAAATDAAATGTTHTDAAATGSSATGAAATGTPHTDTVAAGRSATDRPGTDSSAPDSSTPDSLAPDSPGTTSPAPDSPAPDSPGADSSTPDALAPDSPGADPPAARSSTTASPTGSGRPRAPADGTGRGR
jgi:signal transduction histidine kinase